MTALKKYQRLETSGLWREAAGGQRQEVVVRLGEATLMLTDPRSEAVLSHWSLPAVVRRNPGERPALFAPGEETAETLELTDDDMIAALKTVQAAVRQATPRPGRLRAVLIGGTTLAILLVAVLVLPGVLKTHTASVVPAAKRAEIGQRALDDVTRLTGAPCDGALGLPALAKLSERVFGPEDTPILYLLPEGLLRPAHLPGGVILLPGSLVETDTPEALAAAALAEGVAARGDDPLLPILDHAGLRASFELLTSGELPAAALAGYGEAFLSAAPPPLADATLIQAARDAQVPLSAYARWRDPSGKATAGLLEGDPYRGLMPSPLLPDDDWISLQSVCSD
ncbi:hypothetical protein LHP98_08610 [Rhodobacter sp. Har01]|uniref:hypothetical protein n=1 Tax=Rhodobacter sp. Har01 TaxID=2883999 RepID=UPI001D06ECA3|nr:hypothetical protein [Rhodobacter sp. Har01]MCB6178190.1 hypothetical protein [Rhodobacter sp. Har01]